VAALSEEQRLIRDNVARFLAQHYGFEERQRIIADEPGYLPDHWCQFAELGWLGLAVPESDGGLGGSLAEVALVCEQFGRSLTVCPYLSTVMAARALVLSGISPVSEPLLTGLMDGSLQIRLALEGPEVGPDPRPGEAVLSADGDGGVLSGRKVLVPYADTASHFVVSARNDEGGTGALAVVPADAPGLTVSGYRGYDGSRYGDLDLGQVAVAPGHLLHLDAGDLVETLSDETRALLCAEAAGAMRRTHELTLEYLQTREQFGQPLSAFQALQHRLVDQYVACELAESMARDAVAAVTDASNPVDRGIRVSAAKAHIGEAGRAVGQEAVQLHGGMGMTQDYPVGHYLKRLAAIDLLQGNAAHHRARFRALSDGAG